MHASSLLMLSDSVYLLLLVSIRAVGNVEIGQIYIQAECLKPLLAYDESTPFKSLPDHSFLAEFAEKRLYAVYTEDFEPEKAVRDARENDGKRVGGNDRRPLAEAR